MRKSFEAIRIKRTTYKKKNGEEELIWDLSEWRDYFFLTFKYNGSFKDVRYVPIPKKVVEKLFRKRGDTDG